MKKFAGAVKALGIAVALSVCAGNAAAADYPDGPIRVIVPYVPGGNLDITTRAITTAMARYMKASLVVENMGGAGGSIGAGYVARAKPDGYTLVSTTIVPLVVNPVMVPSTKVHLGDFDPVGMLAVAPSVLEVNAKNKYGIKDFDTFLSYAKAHPNDIAVSHAGNGTTNQIAALMMERDFGIQLNLIPYKGSAPALSDLVGGQVDAMVDQLTSSQPQIDAHTVIPLAATSAQRAAGVPNVPTVAELTKTNFEMVTYSALMAPKGTPLEIRQKLNAALAQAVADPDVKKALLAVGSQVVTSSVDQTAQIFSSEQAKLQPLISSGMLKPE
jgi:tripartite-type tricarboxylate transporter receptor subunit TctC